MPNICLLLGTTLDSDEGRRIADLAASAVERGHTVFVVAKQSEKDEVECEARYPFLVTDHVQFFRSMSEHLRVFQPDQVIVAAANYGLWLQWKTLGRTLVNRPKTSILRESSDAQNDAEMRFLAAADVVCWSMEDVLAELEKLGPVATYQEPIVPFKRRGLLGRILNGPHDDGNVASKPSRSELVFDRSFYARSYPDVVNAKNDVWQHFSSHGWKEGRNPHLLLDLKWYIDTYPEVAGCGFSALDHFIHHGWYEGRQPSPAWKPAPPPSLPEVLAWSAFNPFAFLNPIDPDPVKFIDSVADSDTHAALDFCDLLADLGSEFEAATCANLKIGLLVKAGESASAAEALWATYPDAGDSAPLLMNGICVKMLEAGSLGSIAPMLSIFAEDWPQYLRVDAGNGAHELVRACHWLLNGKELWAYVWFERCLEQEPTNRAAKFGRAYALIALQSPWEALDDFWALHRQTPLKPKAEQTLEDLGRANLGEKAFSAGVWWQKSVPDLLIETRRQSSALSEMEILGKETLLALADGDPSLQSELPGDGSCGQELALLLTRLFERERNFAAAHRFLEASMQNGHPGSLLADYRINLNADKSGISVDTLVTVNDHASEIGRALWFAGAYPAAEKCLMQAIDCNTAAVPEDYVVLAKCRMQLGSFEAAQAAAHAALDIEPRCGPALAVLATILRKYDKAESRKVGNRAVLAGKLTPADYVAVAADVDTYSDRPTALEILDAAKTEFPMDAKVASFWSVLDRLDRLDRLAFHILTAKKANKKPSESIVSKFCVLAKNLTDPERALDDEYVAEAATIVDKVVRKAGTAAMFEVQGDILYRNGNKFDAIGRFEEAFESRSHSQEWDEARLVLAKIIASLEQLELYERAITYLQQYIHGMPVAQCIPQYHRLACYAAMTGQKDLSRQYWSQILEITS